MSEQTVIRPISKEKAGKMLARVQNITAIATASKNAAECYARFTTSEIDDVRHHYLKAAQYFEETVEIMEDLMKSEIR